MQNASPGVTVSHFTHRSPSTPVLLSENRVWCVNVMEGWSKTKTLSSRCCFSHSWKRFFLFKCMSQVKMHRLTNNFKPMLLYFKLSASVSFDGSGQTLSIYCRWKINALSDVACRRLREEFLKPGVWVYTQHHFVSCFRQKLKIQAVWSWSRMSKWQPQRLKVIDWDSCQSSEHVNKHTLLSGLICA